MSQRVKLPRKTQVGVQSLQSFRATQGVYAVVEDVLGFLFASHVRCAMPPLRERALYHALEVLSTFIAPSLPVWNLLRLDVN